MTFKTGDRVRSIGLHSRDYGSGKVIATNRDVATVLFEDHLIEESFHFAMLSVIRVSVWSRSMAKFWQRFVEILDAINGWLTEDIHRDRK